MKRKLGRTYIRSRDVIATFASRLPDNRSLLPFPVARSSCVALLPMWPRGAPVWNVLLFKVNGEAGV